MKPTTQSDYTQRILRVLVHIQQNLDAALPLEDLAAVASFSPFHFHRVFRGMVGETVMQYVRRLRLERAAMRLKHTEQPVTTIAFEAGYEAHEAFTRAFHRAFGRSPSSFRAEGHAGPARIDAPTGVHFIAADEPMSFDPLSLEGNPMDVEI
ncbi:MAG: helix-turn-helix domain-containing protein, partial [Planctomycetota bacterium]